MARTLGGPFPSVRSEGGLLPADFLRRLSAGGTKIESAEEASYKLTPGMSRKEAISRAFTALTGAWRNFRVAQANLREDDPATSLTRERWLLPLFQELGFGRLQTAQAIEIEGRSYPISHAWNLLPIHLVGVGIGLDDRTAGVKGAARGSPHGILQELLNRSDRHLWGLVTNGKTLRLLRDNQSLTRQAYVEFDLETMFDGELFADFALLWLLCHVTRFEGERPETWTLETWVEAARAEGTRVLERLRTGVEHAIGALGSGFLAHPANQKLKESLGSGTLDKQDYFRQLLRMVYRLLFLFVAEDRDLLLHPDAPDDVRLRYAEHYSATRLRRIARALTGTRHSDLFRSLRLVMDFLGRDEGCPGLGVPALGGFLWSTRAVADLANCELANRDLLTAVRALAFTQDGNVLRPVDWKNLGSEELGSVYESLLELHPEIHRDSARFDLVSAAGHERKTTGSYYTPPSLVQCLLDSALDPLLEEARRAKDPESALLTLKVLDPACGSGHFLVAAAHRIARTLASVRTGDEEPSPGATRSAVRDVIGRCLYGVDKNSMALELCKVNLWLEAIEPGRPLSFLEHHIQCGDSLLGATPRLLAGGIPDAAFEVLTGDDPALVKAIKKQNKLDRSGQRDLFADRVAEPHLPWLSVRNQARLVAEQRDKTIGEVHQKEEAWRRIMASPAWQQEKLVADAWCAAFVQRHSKGGPQAIREEILRRLQENPQSVSPELRVEISRLAESYGWFHWHLQFPDVFDATEEATEGSDGLGPQGGFDLVLGNPPWDTLSPDQREFFGQYRAGMRSLSPEEQERVINDLLIDPSVLVAWTEHCRRLFATVHFLKHSGRFTLFAQGNLGKGDFNVYRMFIELAVRSVRVGGYAAQLVPAGLYGGANASAIRRHLLEKTQLKLLLGCENKGESFFPGVHPQTWFCLYCVRRGGKTDTFQAAFGCDHPGKVLPLAQEATRVDASLIRQQSPDTLAIPDIRTLSEARTAAKMYRAHPAFGARGATLPHRHYQRELDMGTDRGLFTTDPNGLPVYEGRMIDHFDHRAKTYVSGHGNSSVWALRAFGDPQKRIAAQWRVLRDRIPPKVGGRVDRYRIGFGDVANPRNERSLAACIIPPGVICGDKVPTIDFGWGNEWAYLPWLAVANSFAMDWLARSRLSSAKMSFTVLDGLPFPRPMASDGWVRSVAPLVLRLICTAPEMTSYWNAMAALGLCESVPENGTPPNALLDEEQRASVRAEIDAIVAHEVYRLTREELSDILDSFQVARKRDVKRFGEYRTKRVILEIFDAMQQAIDTGTDYQTRLDPPPADPRGRHKPEATR